MSANAVRRRGPGSRAGEHHPTRQELVDSAMALADEQGLASLSVDAVTRAAGHAKGTFYVHFADRTELLVVLHQRFHDDLFERIGHIASGMPAGPPRARAQMLAFLDGCRQQPGVRAMLLQARGLAEIAELASQRNAQAAAQLAVDLAGVVPSPGQTAQLLVASTVEVATMELQAGRRLPRLRSALMALVPG